MAEESLILSPLGLESPAIHKVTVHPTGKHSLQPAITFDCISLHNLETLFTQPKTLQSSGGAGSIESMSSDSFLPKGTAIDIFCLVFLVRDCYKDKCRYITWEHKALGVNIWIYLKKASPRIKMVLGKRSYRVNVLQDFHTNVLYIYCAVLVSVTYWPTDMKVDIKKTFLLIPSFSLSSLWLFVWCSYIWWLEISWDIKPRHSQGIIAAFFFPHKQFHT